MLEQVNIICGAIEGAGKKSSDPELSMQREKRQAMKKQAVVTQASQNVTKNS